MTPSKFLFDMQMDTEQKLANTHVMRIPRKVALLDMAETSLQKVRITDTVERAAIICLAFRKYEVGT